MKYFIMCIFTVFLVSTSFAENETDGEEVVIIDEENTLNAVKKLHTIFDLD